MADAIGNVLNVPGISSTAEVRVDEILASHAGFTQHDVTLLKDQGLLPAGQLLSYDATTKKYVAYNGSAGDGVCHGILRQAVDTTGKDMLGNLVVKGMVVRSKLTGLDAGAVADLNAREDTVRDTLSF